jgi:hypothetical protein
MTDTDLMDDVIGSMEWMITQLKWKHRQQLNMESVTKYPDWSVPWSVELEEAMEALEKLKNES